MKDGFFRSLFLLPHPMGLEFLKSEMYESRVRVSSSLLNVGSGQQGTNPRRILAQLFSGFKWWSLQTASNRKMPLKDN